jgi:hypothetical protein
MASGHVNRVNRPDTWLHRPMLRNVKKALANPEPSTHGTLRTCRARWTMSVLGSRPEVAQTGYDFAFLPRLCKNAASHSEAALDQEWLTPTRRFQSIFAVLRLASTPCNVGRSSASSLSPPPAHHARMAASNGLTPTMFSTRVRL